MAKKVALITGISGKGSSYLTEFKLKKDYKIRDITIIYQWYLNNQ